VHLSQASFQPPSWRKPLSRSLSGAPAITAAGVVLLLAGWIFARLGASGQPALNTVVAAGVLFGATYRFSVRGVRNSVWQRCGEALRVLLIAGVATLAVHPFVTDSFVGGQDAKWYAYVLADHVEQSRAGVFPVMVGQGSYQFNGAVHPFRFAPFYQTLGSIIDFATNRTLSVVGLQHGTVIVAAWLSAFSAYYAFSARARRQRWLSWICAALWVLSPTAVALLCVHDMYMSFMAAAWVPLAIHCALRVGERKTHYSAACLGAVLAVQFNCHPPVALWTALLCFSLATWLLWVRRAEWRIVALPLAGVVWLVTLNAFQFQGIAELSPVSREAAPWREVIGVVLCLCVAGLAMHASSAAMNKREPLVAKGGGGRTRASLFAFVAGIGTLLLFDHFTGGSTSVIVTDSLAFSANFTLLDLGRISDSGTNLTDVSPGLALLLGGMVGNVFIWRLREARTVALQLAALALFLVLVPATPVARAFWHTAPQELIAASSGVVNLRITPAWTGALAFGTFGVLAYMMYKFPNASGITLVAGFLAVGWSAWELSRVLQFSTRLTMSSEQTRLIMAPENAALFIYSGNFIGVPEYFSHGVRDYRQESRLLDPETGETTLLVDSEDARGPEFESIMFAAVKSPVGTEWIHFEPTVALPAHQSLDLRFDFGGIEPRGVLVIEGTYFYREYILPSSGSNRAFGTGPTHSRQLPLWSTFPVDQRLHLRFRPEPGRPTVLPGQPFASAVLVNRKEKALQVQTSSLVPWYRAKTDVPIPAILETPRTWIPGYQATRNGTQVDVKPSRTNLLSVPLVVGHNSVEVKFVGSPALRRAFLFSCAVWLVFACFTQMGRQHGRHTG
jgi:hypothetical protein